LIPKAGEGRCSAVNKVFIQIPIALYRTAAWAMNADGTPSDELKAWIGTLPAEGGAGLIPTNLNASDDQTDQITLTWGTVATATSYEVFRGTTSDTAAMTSVKSGISGNSHVDTVAPTGTVVNGTKYFYAVKSLGTQGISGFSNVDSGESKGAAGGATEPHRNGSTSPAVFTVPAGYSKADIFVWGAGGNGGKVEFDFFGGSGFPGGGGGASGSFLKRVDIPIVAGDTFTLLAGTGGSGDSGVTMVRPSTSTEIGKIVVAFIASMTGGQTYSRNPGVGGTPSTQSDTTDTFTVGTPDFVAGNPGTAGTEPPTGFGAGGAGGAAISDGGDSGGAGGTGGPGGNPPRPGSPGANGLTKVVFHN